uniref:Uncharacterized protein n=1 Tax=Romanomermis culicivorax TaxID=13658 RepID=A0A915HZG2_ROMCU
MDIPPNNNVLEKFQHTLDKNPLMGLKFDGPIHEAISKHFGQSHVSPFNNIELGTTSFPSSNWQRITMEYKRYSPKTRQRHFAFPLPFLAIRRRDAEAKH